MANNSRKVITEVVRLMYPNVFEPKVMSAGEAKYSAMILIPKSDVVTVQRINDAIIEAENYGVKKYGDAFLVGYRRKPIYDGSERAQKHPLYNENFIINAKNANPPQIVDRNLVEITDSREIYSGVYVRVSLYFFPYNKHGAKGIAAGLGNIQKIKDGESYGFYCNAASEFSVIDEDFLLA